MVNDVSDAESAIFSRICETHGFRSPIARTTGPKWCRNGAKWSQNGAQMVPKSAPEIGPTIGLHHLGLHGSTVVKSWRRYPSELESSTSASGSSNSKQALSGSVLSCKDCDSEALLATPALCYVFLYSSTLIHLRVRLRNCSGFAGREIIKNTGSQRDRKNKLGEK